MIESFIVAVMVLTAGLYVLWKFTPAALHARVAPPAARLAARLHVPAALVRRLERKVATSGACGSCNSCNACATDPVSVPEDGARRVIPIVPR